MDSKTIRSKFLQFFEKKGHKIVPSAPIVVQNDPTLMFTNAGMNQFKDFFLGNAKADFSRVADTQKCLRVSGKHNDLEEVGFDTYHHTMFEMLGNWSFGDYFKEDAISWAWDFLTGELGLPKDRLYATIFEGDQKDDLQKDQEAWDFWSKYLPTERILLGNKKDNFWEMGDTGPCGPCSEIHIDLRDESEITKVPGKDLVNQDHPQVVEVWNLVFIQFNRLSSGSLESLPNQHVDTGMGFERLAMAMQQKKSNYDTDIFQPLIKEIAIKANIKYGDGERTDIALRVIADHVRAIAFTIADGQLPSSVKAGYVIRRILRRAVRYGYTFLSFRAPFIHELVPTLAKQFEEAFPELTAQQDFVAKVIKEEEVAFLRTLENGLKRLESFKDTGAKVIDGPTAFELYDTYGFPFDLTALIAREGKMQVDEAGFEEEMKKQKERSKSAAKQESGDWNELLSSLSHSSFLGYDQLSAMSKVVKCREVKVKDKSLFQIVLDQTPFYAESGGQVGDTGVLEQNGKKIFIIDTKKENDLIIHIAKEIPEDLSGDFHAKVNASKRSLTENNHSSTHLLHAALREVLGDHVQQRGSLVNEKMLRFDFSHFSKMSEEEIAKVEAIVNRRIRQNIELEEKRSVPIAEAKAMGAMALFGEKYGDEVRVITFDQSFSVELCGGTHVDRTGKIGAFKIVSEGSVAAGVRRIEALTSEGAEEYVKAELAELREIRELLNSQKGSLKVLKDMLEESKQLKKEVESLQNDKLGGVKEKLKGEIGDHGKAKLLVSKLEVPSADAVKQISFQLKQEFPGLIQLLAADTQGKPHLSVMIDESLLKEYDLNASQLVREMAKNIKGGGGGQPFYATAGGKDVSGIEAALDYGKDVITKQLGL